MISNILKLDVPVAGEAKMPAVDKISHAVEKDIKDAAVHGLPQDGKELPHDTTKQSETTLDNIKQAVQSMNDYVQLANRQLEFRLDEQSGRTVITVRDSDTQEIIRQIPDDEALHFAHRLQQGDELKLFDKFV
ncbi:MAG: flagellar protein FlaG [Gammaproteobacteria bacterium]|jgi:flagellar protein FlaG|nr:flagellar protein FlaG [Gammaproteobacteria bacterium]